MKSVLTDIYKKYGQLMYNLALKTLEKSEDAEDAVQQSFVKLLEVQNKIKRMDDEKLKCFLVIVVNRTAIDMLRKRKTTEKLETLSVAEGMPDSFAESDTIKACIKQLPEPQRDYLLLKYQYGFSVFEIAQICKANPETVRKYILRAKNRLFDKLSEEGIDG